MARYHASPTGGPARHSRNRPILRLYSTVAPSSSPSDSSSVGASIHPLAGMRTSRCGVAGSWSVCRATDTKGRWCTGSAKGEATRPIEAKRSCMPGVSVRTESSLTGTKRASVASSPAAKVPPVTFPAKSTNAKCQAGGWPGPTLSPTQTTSPTRTSRPVSSLVSRMTACRHDSPHLTFAPGTADDPVWAPLPRLTSRSAPSWRTTTPTPGTGWSVDIMVIHHDVPSRKTASLEEVLRQAVAGEDMGIETANAGCPKLVHRPGQQGLPDSDLPGLQLREDEPKGTDRFAPPLPHDILH